MTERKDQIRPRIDEIPLLAWSCGPDGTAEFLNGPWLNYTGLTEQQALGQGWKNAIHPEDLRKLTETWSRKVGSEDADEVEARLRRFDGEYRWFLFRAVPVRDAQGHLIGWHGTSTDIEDLKCAQSLLSTERFILEMIVSGKPVQSILESLCNCLSSQYPKMASSVLLLDPESGELRQKAGRQIPREWVDPGNSGRKDPNSLANSLLKQRVVVSDLATDPLWIYFRDSALRGGLRALWCQPIVSKDKQPLGVFCACYPEPRSPSAWDLQLLERAARVALIAIDRERAQTALTSALDEIRKSEARLRRDQEEQQQILEFFPSLLVVLTPDGRPLYANQSFRDYTGVSAEEIPHVGFGKRLSHPEDVEQFSEIRPESLSRGLPFEKEQRLRGKDGIFRWFLVHYKPLLAENGSVIRWYATGIDIHERKQAEDKVRNENLALRNEADRALMFEEIVGASPALQAVLDRVAKVALTNSTVLIAGETGTGKELVARAIHKSSLRSGRTFVGVNCAALAPTLISSELFGHEKGAFTGATQRRLGRFELANGGTIFLDEIGELPADTQIALLRVLQEREIERIGGTKPIPVDVRVIAATNRDLKAAVANGTFRPDLFYRINVFPIRVPPLRERKEDISILLEYFVARYARKVGKTFREIEKQTLELFRSYNWPGNIRELQNVIERSVVISTSDIFSVDEAWLHAESSGSPLSEPCVNSAEQEPFDERRIIEAALRESRGRVSGPNGAAARLKIPATTLESRIKALNIKKSPFKFA